MKRQLLALEQEQKVRRLVASSLMRIGLHPVGPEDQNQVQVTVEIKMADGESIPSPIHLSASLSDLYGKFEREGAALECCEFGSLTVDTQRRQVWVDGVLADLTPREFDLLCYFLAHPNLALTRNQLLDGAWEIGFQGDVRTVDTHVKCLRAKLGDFGSHIITLRKVGYKFDWPNQK